MKRIGVLLAILLLLLCTACVTAQNGDEKIKKPASKVEESGNSSVADGSKNSRFEICDSNGNTILTDFDIEEVFYRYSENSENYYVFIKFNDAGAKIFAYATKTNVGKKLFIYLDGELIVSPTVMGEITDGECLITGLDVEEAIEIWNKISDAMHGIEVE